nr:MFS transporter [Paenibacillus silvae]
MQVVIYGQFFINLGYFSLFPFISLYLLELNTSPATIGMILAARSGSNIVGMLLGGAYADRYGSKRIMNLGLLISSMGYLSLIWAFSPMSFVISFIIIGLFSGFAYPAESKIIIDNTDPENRADAYGLIRTVMNLAAAIAPLIGVTIFLKWPIVSYIAIAIIQIFYVIAVFFMITEKTKEGASFPTNTIKAFTEYGLVFKDSKFMYILLALTLSSVAYYIMETTLPMFLHQRVTDAEHLYTLLLMINTYMVIFLQVFVTKWGKRFTHRKAAAIGQYIYFAALIIMSFSMNAWSLIFSVVLFTLGEMLIASPAFVLLTEVKHESAVGKYQAIARLRLAVAQPISSLVGGFVLQIGGSMAMALSYAFFALLGAVMLTRQKKRSTSEKSFESVL